MLQYEYLFNEFKHGIKIGVVEASRGVFMMQLSNFRLFLCFSFSTLSLLNFTIAQAQTSSAELTCRQQAKEVAAETYKNCMTEQRQSQLEKIRKDYKEDLAKLKSHYDTELKKVTSSSSASGKSSKNLITATQQIESSNPNTGKIKVSSTTKTSSKNMRPSGARNLPAKKSIRTEVIDLTTSDASESKETAPSHINSVHKEIKPETEIESTDTSSLGSQNTDSENVNDTEIVELPNQE